MSDIQKILLLFACWFSTICMAYSTGRLHQASYSLGKSLERARATDELVAACERLRDELAATRTPEEPRK